jgi:hypothetical protein
MLYKNNENGRHKASNKEMRSVARDVGILTGLYRLKEEV